MKRAVISGASSGVGLAIAKRFVTKGWSVVGLARTPLSLASAAADLGSQFTYNATDVRDAAQVRTTFARLGAIDLLVNNAAVFQMKPFAEFDDREIDSLVDTNLKGVLRCTHAALPHMSPGSRIVQLGSVAGTHGIPNQAVYCATKWALEGFSDALAQELIAHGVLVTTIAPGGIDTPLWNAANPYPGPPGTLLTPDDIARAVEFVADLPPHVVMKRMTLFPSNEWH